MRHVILLAVVTLVMAGITWSAWQFDRSRQQEQSASYNQQLSQDALKLEHQYLQKARTLLTLIDPQDPLLVPIDTALFMPSDSITFDQRDTAFLDLVERIRGRLLTAPVPTEESRLQEWRRIQDQMNGALHRRSQLLLQREQ